MADIAKVSQAVGVLLAAAAHVGVKEAHVLGAVHAAHLADGRLAAAGRAAGRSKPPNQVADGAGHVLPHLGEAVGTSEPETSRAAGSRGRLGAAAAAAVVVVWLASRALSERLWTRSRHCGNSRSCTGSSNRSRQCGQAGSSGPRLYRLQKLSVLSALTKALRGD